MKGIRVFLMTFGSMWEPKTEWDYQAMGLPAEAAAKLPPEQQLRQTISYAVLVDHPDAGWILFDTGNAPDPAVSWPEHIKKNVPCRVPPEERMVHQLSLVGLTPGDIKHVITSHMHFDHIGNDVLFKDTADFFVSRLEAEYAYKAVLQTSNSDEHGWYVREDVLLPRRKVTYLEKDEELFEGIRVIQLPGHTPGVMGMVVHAENGTLIFPSDALKFKKHLADEVPDGLYSIESFVKSTEKVKFLQEKYNAKIFYSHDDAEIAGYKKAPLYYE